MQYLLLYTSANIKKVVFLSILILFHFIDIFEIHWKLRRKSTHWSSVEYLLILAWAVVVYVLHMWKIPSTANFGITSRFKWSLIAMDEYVQCLTLQHSIRSSQYFIFIFHPSGQVSCSIFNNSSHSFWKQKSGEKLKTNSQKCWNISFTQLVLRYPEILTGVLQRVLIAWTDLTPLDIALHRRISIKTSNFFSFWT